MANTVQEKSTIMGNTFPESSYFQLLVVSVDVPHLPVQLSRCSHESLPNISRSQLTWEARDASDKEVRLKMNGVRLCASVSVVQAKGNRANCHVLSCWTSWNR